MYVIIKPPNRPSYHRHVDESDERITALFEMACVGQKSAAILPDVGQAFDADARLELQNLNDLLAVLKTAHELAPDVVAEADLSNLPTFGGAVPSGTIEVWSWDESRFLVGSCVSDMRIVPRYGVAS